MCGIVGHIGPQDSIGVVIEGLGRLEYRGYDSAGVSFVNDKNELEVYKKSGRLENLKNELKSNKNTARSCIGHTRWATHGEVNDNNAHPHNNDEIALVHNGIIENADDLRRDLKSKGFEFKSETDTEVFLGLLVTEMKDGASFVNAISNSFSKIKGNSAFVILNKKSSEIAAIKRAAPLVCGINTVSSEVLVSSDPYALVGMADKLYFPEDDVLCSLSASNKHLLRFFELDGKATDRYLSKRQEMTLEASDKGEYEHFMLKEIHEQPELVRSLTQYYFHGEGNESLRKIAEFKPKLIHISACGTAFYAGLVIRDFLEKYNRIPCSADLASEFRYRDPILSKSDLGVFISQSGETADTLAAQKLCTDKGVRTLSLVNVDGSTLYRECDDNLLIRAGVEIGVASTKAFTQQVLTGLLYSYSQRGMVDNDKSQASVVTKLNLLAERIDELIARKKEIETIALDLYKKQGFFYTGRGIYYPVALEGALKLKEIAYVHAEGYAAGELKHGPIALIDETMVNIAIVGPELMDKTVSNIQEIKARKGIIVTIGPNDRDLKALSDYFIELNFEGLDECAPLLVNVANQLLAYYIAKALGTDIDKPRNLAKSVTVE